MWILRAVLCLAATLVGSAAGATAVGAQVQCGDRIRPGEEVVLFGDLECDGSAAALLATGPAILDLNGYTITCADGDADGVAPQVGILLFGWAVNVRNGTVTGCHNGVVAAGSGFHRLDDVATLFGSGDGIVLASDANRVREALVFRHGGAGIAIRGHASTVSDSTAAGNRVGFTVTGARNRLARNEGEDNLIGIALGTTARFSEVFANVARGNDVTDLADATPGCGENRWRQNRFATRNQDCVE
jgi:hypothetical protein